MIPHVMQLRSPIHTLCTTMQSSNQLHQCNSYCYQCKISSIICALANVLVALSFPPPLGRPSLSPLTKLLGLANDRTNSSLCLNWDAVISFIASSTPQTAYLKYYKVVIKDGSVYIGRKSRSKGQWWTKTNT